MYNKETAELITKQGNQILNETCEFLDKVGKSLDDIGNTMDKIDIPKYKTYTLNPNPTNSIPVTVVMSGRWNIFKRLVKGILTGHIKFTIQKRTK